VTFPEIDPLRRICAERLPGGSFFLATAEALPAGSLVEVVFAVTNLEAVLRVSGKVLPLLPDDPRPGLRITVDNPSAASQSAESFLAFADAVLADEAPPPEERRHGARIASRVRVKLRFSSAEQFHSLYTKDIAAGGVFVLSDAPRPVGTPVEVVLLPPSVEEGFALDGTVTHVVTPEEAPGRAGMGVRFDDVPPDARARIEDYLHRIASVPPNHETAEEIEAVPYVPERPPQPEPPFAVDAIGMERRRDVRVQAHVQVKLRPTDLRRFRELYTRDISRGGVFVYTEHPLPRGTRVEVLLYPPGSRDAFSFMGEVVRVVTPLDVHQIGDLPGMGIRFDRVDPKAREVIERIISRVLDEEPPGRAVLPSEPAGGPPDLAEPVSLDALASAPEPLPPATGARAPEPFPSHPAVPEPPQAGPPPPAPRPAPPVAPAPLREGTAVDGGVAKGTWVQQRRDPRYPSRVQTLLRFSTIDDFREAYARDISRGGVFLATAEVRPLRSQVEIVLMPPRSPGIALTGEVVHVVPRDVSRPEIEPGMGIQFLDLTPARRAEIEACLNAVADEFLSHPPPLWEGAHGDAGAEPPHPAAQRAAAAPSTPAPDLAFRVVDLEDAIPLEQQVMLEEAPPPTIPAPQPPFTPSLKQPVRRQTPEEDRLDELLDAAFVDMPESPPRPVQSEPEAGRPPAAPPPPTAPSKPAPPAPGRPRGRTLLGMPGMPGSLAGRARQARERPAPPPGPPPAPTPLSAEQAQSLLEDLLATFRHKNYYEALGLKPNARPAEIAHVLEARLRPLLAEGYEGGIQFEAEEVLSVARQHLETIRATLLDPESRAVYECSVGLFPRAEEGEPGELTAARQRVRQQFRENFTREFPDKVRKGEEFFRAALEDLRSGNQNGALRHTKMALTFDPLNDRYHELLQKLRR
jgi:uncharacterized protein (TIGR02266 family)